jgi:hypothetical protein
VRGSILHGGSYTRVIWGLPMGGYREKLALRWYGCHILAVNHSKTFPDYRGREGGRWLSSASKASIWSHVCLRVKNTTQIDAEVWIQNEITERLLLALDRDRLLAEE